MAIVKQQAARPLVQSAIVLDLADVAQQAQKLRDAARAQAQRVLAEAHARAQQVEASQRQEAFEQGRQEGHAEGHAAGLEAGRAEGKQQAYDEARRQMQVIEEAWLQSAQRWDDFRTQLDEQTRQSVLELALRLAEKIIHRTVQVDPTVIGDQLRSALRQVTGVSSVEVRICPGDRPYLEDTMPQLLAALRRFQHIQLIDDPTLARGGCIVEHQHGQVDVSLEMQLQRVVDLMMPAPATAATSPEMTAAPTPTDQEPPVS